MRYRGRLCSLCWARFLAVLIIAGCGPLSNQPPEDGAGQPVPDAPETPAKVQAVQALSKHYVEVVFEGPAGPAAEDPAQYSITGPNSTIIAVNSVQLSEDRTRAILTTAPQEEVLYTLKTGHSKTSKPATGQSDPSDSTPTLPPGSILFKGSAASEPYLVSAIALDNTTVLLTFSDTLDDNANVSAFYRIENPDLNVLEAVKGEETTVRLTTAVQEHIRYTVQVTNVTTKKGNRLIDPERSTASFMGIAPVDTAPPALLTAASTSNTKVLLSFSEPLMTGVADPLNFSISPSLVITSAELSTYNTQVLLTTLPQEAGVEYTVTASNLKDRAGNLIGDGNTATFTFQGQTQLSGASTLPRVVGAISTSNTSVRVAFSKPMGEGLDDPAHYSITGVDSGFVMVLAVAPSPDRTYVDLTTTGQAPQSYIVHVVNVKDTYGNPLAAPSGLLAPPEGVDPASARFAGTSPVINNDANPPINEHIDSDGDLFADWFETLGWSITIKFANGTTSVAYVTSDPYSPDTDGDGISDADENQWSWDPRTDDTDADHVTDYDEFNVYYTDPANQDTDGDGIGDWLEIFFYKTSPILADTDGDQWTDAEELFERNRNPRLADLPVPQIKVGSIGLFLKESFSYTDEQGQSFTQERSASTTLAQSDERTLSTSDTRSSEQTDSFSQSLGADFEIGKDFGVTLSVNVGFEQTRQRGYSMEVEKSSVESASREEQESLSEATEFSENRSVTRNVEDADLTADVTVTNVGDVAFTITDLELSALVRDPIQRIDVPVATLLPERVLAGGEDISLNLGPFDRDRGPFIFKDVQIFPNVVQDLRRAPRAVVVKVANYNIRSEDGRLFTFASQDINDRTAGLIIDFGNGTVESYRVATASTFDENGHPVGITMKEALETIIGIAEAPGEDPLPLPAGTDLNDPAIRKTYGMATDPDKGVKVLTRVRGVQTGAGVDNPVKKFWVVMSSAEIPTGVDFSDIPLKAGQNITLAFVADNDKDGLFASTEFIYGSSDNNPDTDGDGISDFDEVRTGWTVAISGNERQAFSDPTRIDSDGDGLTDPEERALKTDPRSIDTDEDGLTDYEERYGYEIVLFDNDSDPNNNPILQVTPYITAVIWDGPNGRVDTTLAAGSDDEWLGSIILPSIYGLNYGWVLSPGPNGVIDTVPAGDDVLLQPFGHVIMDGGNGIAESSASGNDIQSVENADGTVNVSGVIVFAGLTDVQLNTTPAGDDRIRAAHRHLFASDPLSRDTDADGLADGREQFLGSDPNDPGDAGSVTDTDQDGLTDKEEQSGWYVTVDGITSADTIASSITRPDTDGDGLPDLLEKLLGLNPIDRDTDHDGLSDQLELDLADPAGYFNPDAFTEFDAVCHASSNPGIACAVTAADSPIGTDPRNSDTDGDGRTDGDEVNTPWTVTVGGTSVLVTSNPLAADSDGDGLNDALELSLGTNPNNVNTDDDNANDEYEVNTRGTDPLVPDQRVTVTYTYIIFNFDNCNEVVSPQHIELHGSLLVTGPDGLPYTLYEAECMGDVADSDAPLRSVGIDLTQEAGNQSKTFILTSGKSIRLFSANLNEHNNVDCSSHVLDKDIGEVDSQDLNYPLSSVSGSLDSVGGNANCTITVNYTLDVD